MFVRDKKIIRDNLNMDYRLFFSPQKRLVCKIGVLFPIYSSFLKHFTKIWTKDSLITQTTYLKYFVLVLLLRLQSHKMHTLQSIPAKCVIKQIFFLSESKSCLNSMCCMSNVALELCLIIYCYRQLVTAFKNHVAHMHVK